MNGSGRYLFIGGALIDLIWYPTDKVYIANLIHDIVGSCNSLYQLK